jgi:hypothetical protein
VSDGAADPAEPGDEEIAAAIIAVLAARGSAEPVARPLREQLDPWVASGWVGQPAAGR